MGLERTTVDQGRTSLGQGRVAMGLERTTVDQERTSTGQGRVSNIYLISMGQVRTSVGQGG